jgi:hypothetical protein
MKGKAFLIGASVLGVAVASGVAAHERDHRSRISTVLKSIEEVPALSTPASGFFKATLDPANQTLSYELSYEGIEGAPTQAHIHFGQAGVNGGISMYLCANVTAPAGTPACPVGPASVTGTLTAANVVGPASQGLAPGEFEALVAAIRQGVTYVNVHSARFQAGEIRGQLDNSHKK